MRITTLEDLCTFFDADEPKSLNQRIYKDTDCGASISVQTPDGVWHHNQGTNETWNDITEIQAFSIQTIVEGSDATVDCDAFTLPVDSEQVTAAIKWMEGEAKRLWKEANGDDEEDWLETWRELGDDMPCPQCEAEQIETQDNITICRACGWQSFNAAAAENEEED